MATLKAVAGPPTGEEAEKSDVDSLLRLVRAHERQHDDRAYDSSAPAAIKRCKTMLTKLRKLLPKLMRPIASLPTDKAVPVLQDLCQLLLLLLGGSVCPHSKTLFMENNSRASGSEDVGTSGFPSYPTMATMLFYMVSFYCNEKLQQAQSGVRSVVLKMAHFLLSNDVHGFLHFFNDTVQFLEDCFLLEDCLKQRESTGVLPGGVFITCFLDTAIHVYQDADGPLGSTTNATLCGCMPITDEDQLDKRRDQLSRMLPPVHVASYRAVVELRQSMTILADQIIYEHGAMVEKVPAYERLCQLVELFLDKNGTLLESASDVFEDGAVSKEAAGRVAQSTFRLLYTMMQASASTDERFTCLRQAFFKFSCGYGAHLGALAESSNILDCISTTYPNGSTFVLWPHLESWISRSMHHFCNANHENKRNIDVIWQSVVSILGVYIRQSKTTSFCSPASLFVDLLDYLDIRAVTSAVLSSVIDGAHIIMSEREMLTKVVLATSKSLVNSKVVEVTSNSKGRRKRKRSELSVSSQRQPPSMHRHINFELHENLSRWLLGLMSLGNGSDRKSIVALSIVLRVVLPLRRYITAFARLEGFAIFRALLQRVGFVLNTCAPSLRPLTNDYLDLWLVLLQYFDDHELETHRDLLGKVVESIESQQIFERSVERDKSFVAPECWEYLDFLELYKLHPKCHDEPPVDDTTEAFYDHLRSSGAILVAIFQKPVALRGSFLVYFVWSRPITLSITDEDSWRNALPWRIAYRAIMQETSLDVVVCSFLAMSPLLAFFAVSESMATSRKMVTCLMEAFSEKIQRTGSRVVTSAIIQASGAVLCATLSNQPLVDRTILSNHPNYASDACGLRMCQCRRNIASFERITIPLALFWPILRVDGVDSEYIQAKRIIAMASVFEHCEVDYENDETTIKLVEQLLSSFESGSGFIRQTVIEVVAHHQHIFDAMIDPVKSSFAGLLERLEGLLLAAEKSSNDRLISSLVLTCGSIGCGCNLGDRGMHCVWILLRLVSLWNRFVVANRMLCAAIAFDQICRITTHHCISWRQLCDDYPEEFYFPLVDELMETQTLKLFLRTYMGGQMDTIAFLKASAPYVLPKYIVDQNEEMLLAYVEAYVAADEEKIRNESEDDPVSSMTISVILFKHIEYVLKDLIMHQVQAVSNKNRLAEWEFLFKFLPENSTVNDAISHAPLRLMNLLVWELGGPQFRMAKRAMREVANNLNDNSRGSDEQMTSLQSGEMFMPRQYFLALMTELGGRINEKPQAETKIRAMKSIDRLLELYSYSSADFDSPVNGIVDPYVPKVMATLKVGLMEHEVQEYAIQAWGNFLKMLSTKALGANLSSIIVSLLPCLGYDAAGILLEDEAPNDNPCWTVESLERMKPAVDSSKPSMSSGIRSENQKKSIAAAVGILRYLLIEKRAELKPSFPKIPLLPSIPELDEIYVVLYEDGDPRCRPLREYLMNLSEYVNHLDVGVREVALTQLLRCLIARGAELKALLQNEGDIYIDRAVASVVQSVLQLSRTESQETIKLLSARCLGALGAIDDARVPLSMLYTSGGTQGSMAAKEKLNQKIEYSTKDLACAVIELWLVKELRAAPENTDSLAFAIQELLRFLAELTADPQHSGQSLPLTNTSGLSRRERQNAGAPMPDWMKRRFERKDVLQFVEPYWSTNYHVSGSRSSRGNMKDSEVDQRSIAPGNADRNLPPARDDISYYEKYGTSYEEWLLMWCRRLTHLSQPPERKIFKACRTALPTCPQLARFLLPYLIQNVLRSGRTEVGEELKKEFMAVLDDQDCGVLVDDVLMAPSESEQQSYDSLSSVDVPEKISADHFRRHDQCSQTIFSTIDELNEWIWASEKKRLALSGSAASRQASASGRTDIPSDMDDREKDYLDEFLKEIPSRSLSNAAYQVKAFARAIQYFEVFLRQQEYTPEESRDGSTEMVGPVPLSLVSSNAFYLQQLYKSVDEPDALIGLATLRRLSAANGHDDGMNTQFGEQEEGLNLSELMHQIVDHKQLAQWEDALACYEQAIQEIQSTLSARDSYPSQPFQSQQPLQNQGHNLDDGVLKDPDRIKPELYSGMIGCLIQLGRLESALQHINGIVTQEPRLMGTLYPFALECSWRLSRWDLLTELLGAEKKNPLLLSSTSTSTDESGANNMRLKGVDISQMMLVRVLHSLHSGQHEEFERNLKTARLEVMGPLAAASTESYQRAYPLLHKLHFLHEAEQGFIFLQRTKMDGDLGQRSLQWKQQSPWDLRYDLLATPLKYRDPILALRRVILHEAGLRSEVSENWLLYAKLTRKEGFIRTASSAIMHAEALKNQYASLEKAKLLVSQDRMHEALQILEPVDIDASTLDFDVEDPHFWAKNLLLATNWMQESGQRQGKKVIERYQAVIHFDPKWEKGYFFLAKYYEYLLSVSHPEAMNGSVGGDEAAALLVDSVFHAHLINLMRNYVQALAHGTKFVFQSLPRLLTLWFAYGEVLYTSGGLSSSKANKAMRQIEIGSSQSTTEQQVLDDITKVVNEALESLPAYEWLVCLPQVTSRICHPNPVVVNGVKKIMLRVLAAYPTQAMWPLLGLSRSLNGQRKHRARDVITNTQQQFVAQGLKEIADSFTEGMRMAEELISLAGYDPGSQRKIHIRLARLRTKILVPIQTALTTVLPTSGLAPRDEHHVAFSPDAQVYIRSFSDKADVMFTKEKPKRIEVMGSDGQMYPFLCKREKTGDLRKDARMMEFNTMINKLLQKDREGRKRKLRLRTYAVVCLNEESGLMEWVQHTKAMRQLIGQIHKTERGYIQPVRLTSDVKERYMYMQKKYASDPPMMARYYSRKVLSMPALTPRFHQWFYNNFADPTAWFEARLAFSRSAAVWSMVGHIIGLGDRHGENILIDCTNGECVHVDFDCLFDKGLKLAKPEIVPFRLTPNMIDAFGITGYEGVFRRVSEVTMHLLRENKETLRSVLESFIHDPLVEWGRRGKATQNSSSSGKSAAELTSERSKEETRLVLRTIDDRLRGIYNLGDAIRPLVSPAHRNILPENETLPLSVQGQVDKLIHEATSLENLAQMYIGWMPFL